MTSSRRITIVTTRTGDDGSTGLADGSRLPKTDARVHAMGDVDELNAQLGVLRCESVPSEINNALAAVQNDLFQLGANLCCPGQSFLQEDRSQWLESLIQRDNAQLPALAEFILPGGSKAAALAHVARTVCRRAERSVLAANGAADASSLYLNRLSDWLFVLARVLNRYAGVSDVYWQKRTAPESEGR